MLEMNRGAQYINRRDAMEIARLKGRAQLVMNRTNRRENDFLSDLCEPQRPLR